MEYASSKQINFNFEKDCESLEVWYDQKQMQKVVNNLLSNAIKFTQSGTVTLSTDYKNNVFTLVVEDTGTGITKEQQQRIFIPFERLGNAVTEDGFGLGLAIVRTIVQRNRGEISVSSTVGKGTVFTVTFPAFDTEVDKS